MDHSVDVMIMSGVDDGAVVRCSSRNGDGLLQPDCWTISIGRLESSDIRLASDTFISREHAKIHWRESQWWLEDLNSRNGTFIINPVDFFDDSRVSGIIPIQVGQLFRIGRTWLQLEAYE